MPEFKTGIYINPRNGYCYYNTAKNRKRLVHRVIWEETYGKIPIGYEIHHKDGNKQNNEIENLQLVSHKEHFRYHQWPTPAMIQKSIEVKRRGRLNRQNKVKQLFIEGMSVKNIIHLLGYGQTTVYRYLRA